MARAPFFLYVPPTCYASPNVYLHAECLLLMPCIRTAVIPAAGLGRRLRPLTDSRPKCLVEVDGVPLLERTIHALEQNGFERLVLITGYRAEDIRKFIACHNTSLQVETVHSARYDVTNNIYSLWQARTCVDEAFVLIESDLIFEPSALAPFTQPNRIALEAFDPMLHSGSTVVLGNENRATHMYVEEAPPHNETLYKTVNIYSFSASTWSKIRTIIARRIDNGRVNCYHEAALAELVDARAVSMEAVDFSDMWWDEIDTPEDLDRVKHELQQAFSGS